jgi:chromosome segregation ATPase
VASLQREVERLNQALLKVQEGEGLLKERNQSLSQSLQEVSVSHSATQGRLVTLQKSLSTSEQEKRQLQVGFGKTGNM